MHQPFDETADERMSYESQVAFAWCLVQEGLCDFRFNSRTKTYDFKLNAKGEQAHRRSMENYDGRDIAGDLDIGDNY